jgi:hypothetical protein
VGKLRNETRYVRSVLDQLIQALGVFVVEGEEATKQRVK